MNDTNVSESDQEEGAAPASETVSDAGKVGVTPALAGVKVVPTFNAAQHFRASREWRAQAEIKLRSEKKHAATLAATPARKAKNQRDRRARIRSAMDAEVAPTLAALDHLELTPSPKVDRQTMVAEATAFREWLDLNGPRQRQYRPQKDSYMTSRVLLLHARLELDGDPAPADFAARLTKALAVPVDRMQARNRLARLLKLEEPGGPWFPGAGFV